MKVVVVGSGALGGAVQQVLAEHGYEVLTVGRTSGMFRADLSDRASLDALFAKLGSVDAVANAAGDVFPAPLPQTTDDHWTKSFAAKGMGQINLVRAGLPFLADNGSFTLVSGVLGDEVAPACTVGATVNRLVEGFVQAAASELPRGVRINCVSPTVLTESPAYYDFFPGFTPVPALEVAHAYLRAIANPITGRILKLHKTNA